MFKPFLSQSFWTDSVDWFATGTLIDRLKPTAEGLAAKAFLLSGGFEHHLVGPVKVGGYFDGTAGNDLIENFGASVSGGVRDGAGEDLVVSWSAGRSDSKMMPDAGDSQSLDVFVCAPGARDYDQLSYGSAIHSVHINLETGWATGADIGKDRLINVSNVIGGAGNDVIIGGGEIILGGGPWLDGGGGDDVIFASLHRSIAGMGGDGNDRIYGSDQRDSMFGHKGEDLLSGGGGNDLLSGLEGHDTIKGGNGDDFVNPPGESYSGETDGDWIDGGNGDDVLYGTKFDDRIIGGEGDDTINTWHYGSSGPDLNSYDFDTVSGGGGADTFSILPFAYNNSIYYAGRTDILDFQDGVDKLADNVVSIFGEDTRSAIDYNDFRSLCHDTAKGLVYDNGLGHVIKLHGFTLAMLDPSDFI
jgi:Ca2+-binding RTX toxin-like protein